MSYNVSTAVGAFVGGLVGSVVTVKVAMMWQVRQDIATRQDIAVRLTREQRDDLLDGLCRMTSTCTFCGDVLTVSKDEPGWRAIKERWLMAHGTHCHKA